LTFIYALNFIYSLKKNSHVCGSIDRINFGKIVVLAVILAFYIIMAINFAQGDYQRDYVIFYHSAQNFIEGKNIYAPIKINKYSEFPQEAKSILNTNTFFPNLNPPFQTLLFLPFLFLTILNAYLV